MTAGAAPSLSETEQQSTRTGELNMDEASYEAGSRMAWRRMLQTAVMELGIEDPAAAQAAWILEREAAISALRRLCEEHGDNSWPSNLNLADVIEKYLGKHLNRHEQQRQHHPRQP
jgi:hypothetical protein